MSCAQCQHENRPGASFCDRCGTPLLHLWPQADLRPHPGRARRRRRILPRAIDVIAAVSVVVTGLAVISSIVMASPRWQGLIPSWRGSVTAHAASVPRLLGTAVLPPSSLAVKGEAMAPEAPSPRPGSSRPGRAPEPAQAGGWPAVRAQSDSTQVMASLLVSQLGLDPAWRTALANADAVSSDSPEYAYWRAVAAAIRDGAAVRVRP